MTAMPTDPAATRMYAEIGESAAAIARQREANASTLATLARALREAPPRFVVTAARGSSDNAATYAKYLIETQLGLATASAAPSIHSVYAAQPNFRDALFIAISQSGRSPDLLRQAEAAKRSGARVVALVNVADSPLAGLADTVLPLHAGPELSVAATKSYLCSLAAIADLVAHWSGDEALSGALDALPRDLGSANTFDWSPLVDDLADARNLFVVGRGLGLSAAQESALKLKETCGLHAEAFSAAEVQHGPMALVERDFPVLFFTQDDDTLASTLDVASRFRERGARVRIARAGAHAGDLPFAATLHPACAPIAAVHAFYYAANALSVRRGRNPDVPPHLRKVTETV
jgi:glucosamine--fructose-6-phosphate aminotransferase (isomerizing)